jgi:hypothetical protein
MDEEFWCPYCDCHEIPTLIVRGTGIGELPDRDFLSRCRACHRELELASRR